jgi:hypothetical protein
MTNELTTKPLFAPVISLLSWAFEHDISASESQHIDSLLRKEWLDSPRSSQEVVACLIWLNQTISVFASGDRAELRPAIRLLLIRELAALPDDAECVLHTLRNIVEERYPGITETATDSPSHEDAFMHRAVALLAEINSNPWTDTWMTRFGRAAAAHS